MIRKIFLLTVALLITGVFTAPTYGQVRLKRGSDGVLRITDQDDGTPDQGYGLKWQRKNKVIEVLDPHTQIWFPGPGDYPNVVVSQCLLLAFGAGSAGCAVYDSRKQTWIASRVGCALAQVSENLAVGYGGDGGVIIYNGKTGRWENSSTPHEQLVLTDDFLLVYGPNTRTQAFDAGTGSWTSDNFNSYDQCVTGRSLAVLFRRNVPACTVYDSANRVFVALRESVESAQVTGSMAVIQSTSGTFSAYSSRAKRWTPLIQARSVSNQNGEIRAFDESGNSTTYRNTEYGFEPVYISRR